MYKRKPCISFLTSLPCLLRTVTACVGTLEPLNILPRHLNCGRILITRATICIDSVPFSSPSEDSLKTINHTKCKVIRVASVWWQEQGEWMPQKIYFECKLQWATPRIIELTPSQHRPCHSTGHTSTKYLPSSFFNIVLFRSLAYQLLSSKDPWLSFRPSLILRKVRLFSLVGSGAG